MRRILSKLDDLLLVVVIAGGGWWGVQELRPGPSSPPAIERAAGGDEARPAPPPDRPTAAEISEAQALLESLAIKGRAPKAGYERSRFGQRWSDVDRNGCDTRNDMLRRDLTEVVLDPNTNGCVVLSGTLVDPYTGTTIPFVKGNTTSTAVQIDHVVALSDAWQKGAQGWDERTRTRFANDQRNLQAVGQAVNQGKGDGDAATWLPPNKSFRCRYVANQVTVKAAYGLWVTPAEAEAMGRVLESCEH